MQFVCSSKGVANWPAGGRQNPTFRHCFIILMFENSCSKYHLGKKTTCNKSKFFIKQFNSTRKSRWYHHVKIKQMVPLCKKMEMAEQNLMKSLYLMCSGRLKATLKVVCFEWIWWVQTKLKMGPICRVAFLQKNIKLKKHKQDYLALVTRVLTENAIHTHNGNPNKLKMLERW